ncbi:MAG: MBL fold metallo-hydrolase, partial [Marinirhabdus sp.]
NVTFLGTGTSQGVPIIGLDHPVCKSTDPRDKRLRVSVLLQWDSHNYVIDCGPDFRQQMLREHVQRLDGVLLTHEHSDHTAGLDDIRPYYFAQGDVRFYASSRVFGALHQRFPYFFESAETKYPGVPTISEVEIEKNKPFNLQGKNVLPFEVLHGDLPILGFKIEGFTYITDAKTVSERSIAKIKPTQTLVVNALREKPHHSHFNIEEALALVEKIKPERTYLTHISHLLGFHEEVQKKLPPNVFLAYDGLKIEI